MSHSPLISSSQQLGLEPGENLYDNVVLSSGVVRTIGELNKKQQRAYAELLGFVPGKRFLKPILWDRQYYPGNKVSKIRNQRKTGFPDVYFSSYGFSPEDETIFRPYPRQHRNPVEAIYEEIRRLIPILNKSKNLDLYVKLDFLLKLSGYNWKCVDLLMASEVGWNLKKFLLQRYFSIWVFENKVTTTKATLLHLYENQKSMKELVSQAIGKFESRRTEGSPQGLMFVSPVSSGNKDQVLANVMGFSITKTIEGSRARLISPHSYRSSSLKQVQAIYWLKQMMYKPSVQSIPLRTMVDLFKYDSSVLPWNEKWVSRAFNFLAPEFVETFRKPMFALVVMYGDLEILSSRDLLEGWETLQKEKWANYESREGLVREHLMNQEGKDRLRGIFNK